MINVLEGRRNGKFWQCALGDVPAEFRSDGAARELGIIRPERIKLVSPETSGVLVGEIRQGTFLGECWLWQVDCRGIALTVRESAGPMRTCGESVGIYLEPGFFQIIPEE